MRTTTILTALAVAAIALPVAAQTKELPMASERVGQEVPVQKKTPEQIAKEKADKEKIRADAMKAQKEPVKSAADRTGQETPVTKKTPEQIAADKASKAKRGTTLEEQKKQARDLPGG